MLDITANSATYRGGEGQSVFPIPFPFLETPHIRAHVRKDGGADRALAAGVDYSVNRVSDANGELILLGDDLPEGTTLTVTRLVPLTQEILFHNQGPNSPKAMEEAVDKLTMIAQQFQSELDAVKDGGNGGGGGGGIVPEEVFEELAKKIDRETVTELLAAKSDVGHTHDGEIEIPDPVDLTDLEAGISALEADVSGLTDRLDSLGAMAAAADAPANDKPHMRRNGNWVEYAEPSSGGGGAPSGGGAGSGSIIGEIRFLPFRSAELPGGWYFCDGAKYPLSSPQGTALSSLPPTMKTDWGIITAGSEIALPNLLSDAGGYFVRAVDNSSRYPGSKQADAIRNITGSFALSPAAGVVWVNTSTGKSAFTGAFRAGAATKAASFNLTTHGYNAIADLNFDASAAVATADENRPLNIGMTPAMYLGV